MNEKLERLYKRKAFLEDELDATTLDISMEESKDKPQEEETIEERYCNR